MISINQKSSGVGFGFKSAIGRRMIIWILLFSSFVTFLGTSLQLYLDYAGDIKYVKSTMNQIENSYLRSIISSLWITDFELVELQLQGILRLPEMQYLEIIEDGTPLLTVGKPQYDNIIRREYNLIYNYNGKKIQLGTLRATASLNGIYDRLLNKASIILATQTVKTFLVSAFIIFVFYYLVGQHLFTMASYTKKLNFSDLKTPLLLRRKPSLKNDELDQLVLAINSMRNDIFNKIQESKDYADQLENLNHELLHKNKELEQVVYVTSHDLRSPLVNIQGFSNELKSDFEEIESLLKKSPLPEPLYNSVEPILNEDIPQSLKFIFSSVLKMDSLLSGLLKISRLGRSVVTLKPVDMAKMFADVIGTFEFLCQENNVNIQVEELDTCLGDEVLLNQVFSNLVANAIKFKKTGQKGNITIYSTQKGSNIIYCVADDGIGIDIAHQEKIFEIFHQLSPEASSGEGLGLNIVRKIVDLHRGQVWVDSEPGVGSRFYVSLNSTTLKN